jgi:hypothetical protein
LAGVITAPSLTPLITPPKLFRKMDLPRRVCGLRLLLLLLAAPALAQPPTAQPNESRRDKSAEVPDAEKIKISAQALKHMRDVLAEVFGKLKEARESNDVVKAACVNESLTQVKALLRIAEQADVAMQDNIAKRNQLAAEDEFTKLNIAPRKVDELRAKAEECMGQLAFQTVGMTVEVEEPRDIPKQDLTNPEPPTPTLVRPPPASPTL